VALRPRLAAGVLVPLYDLVPLLRDAKRWREYGTFARMEQTDTRARQAHGLRRSRSLDGRVTTEPGAPPRLLLTRQEVAIRPPLFPSDTRPSRRRADVAFPSSPARGLTHKLVVACRPPVPSQALDPRPCFSRRPQPNRSPRGCDHARWTSTWVRPTSLAP
jgi:hypothetical protein